MGLTGTSHVSLGADQAAIPTGSPETRRAETFLGDAEFVPERLPWRASPRSIERARKKGDPDSSRSPGRHGGKGMGSDKN